MSKRANIYEKYQKSDIFNLNPVSNNFEGRQTFTGHNLQYSTTNTEDKVNNTIDSQRAVNQRRYMLKQHQSDIFNVNKSFDNTKKQKIRGDPNISTCFDSMKDNTQFANDIKEYTLKKRGIKTKYDPDKYLHNEDATERLYNQLYDKNRNPILSKTNNNIKNSNNDLNNEKNDKNLFLERKKTMKNQFINKYFDQRNRNDIKKLEKEAQQAEKLHKYYKSKGFTYKDNENNNLTENKFVTPDKCQGNSSKINRQIQLQSNIFSTIENNDKNVNDIDKINERIKTVENEKDKNKEKKEKKMLNTKNNKKTRNIKENENDRNIWGSVKSRWEKSNLDWRNAETEIIFGKTYNGEMPERDEKNSDEKKNNPFQKKMEQLQDSGNKDTINESIKTKRKYNKNIFKDNLNPTSNLEQINEILDEIPENVLKYDKKKKIIFNANTTGLNGETDIDPNFTNYNKYHKNINKNKKLKEPKIKIMSKDGEKNINKRKNIDKNVNNLKAHEDYNIHDFVLSYDSKAKNAKNNLDKYSDKDIKLLFSKKGIHVYDIQKKYFDNGKYNIIKFKVRENEGENALKDKMKEIENDLSKKQYNICIEKDVEKEKKKNLRNVVNAPGSKVAMFAENNENKNNFKKKEPLQIKNSTRFTGQFNMIDHKYKSNNN